MDLCDSVEERSSEDGNDGRGTWSVVASELVDLEVEVVFVVRLGIDSLVLLDDGVEDDVRASSLVGLEGDEEGSSEEFWIALPFLSCTENRDDNVVVVGRDVSLRRAEREWSGSRKRSRETTRVEKEKTELTSSFATTFTSTS